MAVSLSARILVLAFLLCLSAPIRSAPVFRDTVFWPRDATSSPLQANGLAAQAMNQKFAAMSATDACTTGKLYFPQI